MRYYFHLRSASRFVEDWEGDELDGIEAARREAAGGARDMIAEDLRASRRIELDMRFEVTDESGDVVHSLSLDEALQSHISERGGHARFPAASDAPGSVPRAAAEES